MESSKQEGMEGEQQQANGQPPAIATSAAKKLDDMTPEEKVAHLANLMKLRDEAYKKAGKQPPPPPPATKSYPAPVLKYAFTDEAEFYDDEDEDMYDDYDADLQAFEHELGLMDPSYDRTPSTTSSSHAFGDLAMNELGQQNEVVVTDPYARRDYLGDFELLRLAKMGDIVSFKSFEELSKTNVTCFADNHSRDSLHFAVDSGSLELVKYLVEEKNMGLRTDDRGMNALDIAALLKHATIAEYLKSRFPHPLLSFEEALRKLAPKPPKFCLAKGAPPVLPDVKKRSFWDVAAEPVQQITSAEETTYTAEILSADDGVKLAVRNFSNRANTGEQRGLDSWTYPLEQELLEAIFPRAVVVGVTGVDKSQQSHAAGVGFSVPIGGTIAAASWTIEKPYLASCFNAAPAHQKKGVNTLMMHKTKDALVALPSTGGVLFRSSVRLPQMPMCLLKWFRRALNPQKVFAHLLASSEVYSDFYAYDDRLRVDSVAKELLKAEQLSTPTLASWSTLSDDTLEFVATNFNKMMAKAAGAEISYRLDTVDDLKQSFAMGGIRSFFIASPTDGMTDFVSFRPRYSREKNEAGTSALLCGVVTFCCFTTISGEKKLAELLAIAGNLSLDVLYLPNTCGFTDSDFSKGFFEETESYREYCYAITKTPLLESPVKAMVPTPKVFLPVGLI